ncbi:LLM class flavin-dependent oxidoreductase [Ottowia thiooxydans]|uniref:LLM class flavin-dependent oxidoreductase n=1 Tax=Ottowia thiooxydans TaxID=219182 RepID=UPI0004274BBA|nr:LLM class flavin-dependent oxidoreductase [Ottowia thiooxydans]
MKIGIFDHLDRRDVPLHQYYADRLELVTHYDRLGFYAYHVAEHHATPLGMAPSPSVFLSSVAQRTRRLKFGPLVYTLPLYHPLRVAEEICMLDHLSQGRLQVGVGRGISPIEVGFYGVDPAKAQAMYIESYAVLMKALTSEVLDHEGEFFRFKQVPVELRPLQQPHPPIWYGVGNADGADWCVANNVNAVVNGPIARVREITDRFRAQWAGAGKAASALPLIGTSRHVVVAPTDAKALAIAERAYARWYASFMYLWLRHGSAPQFTPFPESFQEAQKLGLAVAGSPSTVRQVLAEQVEQAGVNYLLARFAFGDLTLAESTSSVELFAAEVMPALCEEVALS